MTMPATPQSDAKLGPFGASTTSRATIGGDGAAPPPLTSGFGAVMGQERDIRAATGEQIGVDHGPQSAALDRILVQQASRLGANVALLEQRYEMLPHPLRFHVLRTKQLRLARGGRAVTGARGDVFLPGLVARHMELIRKIDALITRRADGRRAELILTEVARNHEEMAWSLTVLIREDELRCDGPPRPTLAGSAPTPLVAGEANWENEGGAPAPLPSK